MTATRLAVLSLPLLFTRALSELTPTAPGPGQTFNAGSECTIEWQADESGTWTNVTIDLKSGSNDNQTLVTNVVSGLDGTDSSLTPYTWTCPEVDPYSAIYFYEFTNNGDTSTAQWTTRFTIASPTDDSVTPPNSVQPNGDPIPWGSGHLAGDDAGAGGDDEETAGDDANAESIGVNQVDFQDLSRSKSQPESQDASGHDDSEDRGNDREDPSDSDTGSNDSQSSDSDSSDENSDDENSPSFSHGRTKNDPTTDSPADDSGTNSGDDKSGDDKTAVAGSTSESDSPKSSAPETAKLEAPTETSYPPKAAPQAPSSASASSTSAVHAKAVTVPGPGATTAASTGKSLPTPGLPSSAKAHASAASAASPASSGTCQCPGSEKAGLKLANGSAEREKISGWVMLYPLIVTLLVLY
ncbi:hypothetical protein NM688_g3698 [Phlebia brevispora]|uniref:Uncharacterized protein n=1 Tax=Phlebia brevispora TaxID=194682 RepID=A0ACC1T5D9_9APHY|nr:hypothetical protein NM688_g3698 [Phlebia brevispora]